MMHEREKSEPAIRAGKPANKADATSVADDAESVEQRSGAKGNADEQSTHRTQSRECVLQALDRVRKVAWLKRKEKLTGRWPLWTARCAGRALRRDHQQEGELYF
jgi:RNA-directed DNA polymerase